MKPVLVDDPAYLMFARHIAAHPLDPYGFDIFWYSAPEPAAGVLCPPVVPYWLALGVRLFGDNPPLLKLWLFPFVWVFAWALRDLLRRFARGTERAALPLIVLSPAVLPLVNLMLDVPVVALGLAAVAIFARACDRGSWRLAVAAGVVAALAMQTKYTALLAPPVLAWYGLTHRRVRLAAVAVAAAVGVFAGWEGLIAAKYGESHFLYHVGAQQAESEDDPGRFWREKWALVAPLAGHLGCLAVGIGLYAGRAVGIPRRALVGAAAVWVVGVALIAALPHRDTILVRGKEPGQSKLSLGDVVWRSAGVAVLLAAAGCAAALLVRCRRGRPVRWSADSWFVVGWVLMELGGYFVLTPFPAARRVIGLTVVLGILAARTVSRVRQTGVNPPPPGAVLTSPTRGEVGERSEPGGGYPPGNRPPTRPPQAGDLPHKGGGEESVRPVSRCAGSGCRPPRWVVPFGVAVGVLVAALDTYDALPEKVLAERAAAVVRAQAPDARIWYVGHWGFQYYCERAGMRPVVAGESVLAPGDYVVFPVFPDAPGFYRPDSVHSRLVLPPGVTEVVEEVVWDDLLPAQTIPNVYGGTEPIAGRDFPRLRVQVRRVVRAWPVPAQ